MRPKPSPRGNMIRTHSAIDMWLGQQIRQLRKSQRKSLADLASACQMSVGLLSQIERGMSSVSVKSLQALSRELNVGSDLLLRNAEHREGEAQGRVARAGTHRRLDLDDKGIFKEIVSPRQATALDLCRVRISAGGSTGEQWFSTDKGEQVGLVLRGSLELWINNQVVLLNAGDSFCYSSSTPRRWRNPGTDIAEVIFAISNIHSA